MNNHSWLLDADASGSWASLDQPEALRVAGSEEVLKQWVCWVMLKETLKQAEDLHPLFLSRG